jgi:Uncharacterized protein conserved in bacteria
MLPGQLSNDERLYGMLCHLLAFAGLIIPLGSIIGPLVIWLIKREQYSYVDVQGKEALNFQISILIYGIISSILIVIFIGILTSIIIGIAWIVLTIIGTLRAYEGRHYQYPLTIRFLK